MTEINSVSIKLQTGVYGQFRNLNNKIWFALGEFVDNAVQSFENNKIALISNNPNYQFEVKIDINWEGNFIKIIDNAAGIDENNFPRAFEPANIPIDNSGLNEFGMGMKTASIWLSDFWTVRTGALGEKVERIVEFDLKKVLAEKKEVLQVKNNLKDHKAHFTEIVLESLSKNAPSAFQMDKIKKHLASIYRKFIRNGDLKLFINGDLLTYEDPEILVAPHFSNIGGPEITWKKEVSFSSGKYSVKGFIGILNTMSTNDLNGLSLFRRGRVIEGSHDEKYRPKVLCGQVGSPRYKRIFGELELEGFAVSFNKGSFQEQDDLEALMEAIKVEVSSKEFDLLNQAEKYIKPKSNETNVTVGKKIVKTLKQTSKDPDYKEKIKSIISEIQKREVEIKPIIQTPPEKSIDFFEEEFEIDNEVYTLRLEMITESSIKELYSLIIHDKGMFSKKIIYKINLAHPFFIRFEKFKKDDDYQPIITIIRSLVLAEVISQTQGTKNAGNVRINFNEFLKTI